MATRRKHFPVLNEVLAKIGTEKGQQLVGEVYDLATGAVLQAFDELDVNPFLKAGLRGPLDMVVQAGRGIVVQWAQSQRPTVTS
jgi:hypothetical protein